MGSNVIGYPDEGDCLRMIARRMVAGETLETILLDYPKLSEEEKETIRENLGGQV